MNYPDGTIVDVYDHEFLPNRWLCRCRIVGVHVEYSHFYNLEILKKDPDLTSFAVGDIAPSHPRYWKVVAPLEQLAETAE